MAYDVKCYDLAKVFLDDRCLNEADPNAIKILAQRIQTVVEDFIERDWPDFQ